MPDAELVNLEGTPVHLRSLIGKKPVLIEFWATWCGVCKALKPRLEAAQAKYGDRVEFIVLAVSVNQTRSETSDYVKAHGLPGRPLYDSQGAAMAAFGVAGTGYVFLMNRDSAGNDDTHLSFPAFAAGSILTLALGLDATTALLTIADRVCWRRRRPGVRRDGVVRGSIVPATL